MEIQARKMQKCVKKETLKIAAVRTSETKQHKLGTLNNSMIQNTIKCNMQRMNMATTRFLFISGVRFYSQHFSFYLCDIIII